MDTRERLESIEDTVARAKRWSDARRARIEAARAKVQPGLFPHLNSIDALATHLERAARTIRAYVSETLKVRKAATVPVVDGFKVWDREAVLGYVNESRALLDLIEQEATAD
jgi:hypothetical protein